GGELARLSEVASRAGRAVIVDEVFAPCPFGRDPTRVSPAALDPTASAAVPIFSLGGLSKACGLPHLKLGWVVVGGPEAAAAIARLELIADTYLSVAAPVQHALADLFALGGGIRAAIAARLAGN